uniref:DUF4435 domain-containing protein n=1 Tax=Candidatus Kentrum sp. LFY TaxID=2126342 RepID=A0A450UIV9_9GAMM|nr:MAG: Protein of unknown function (DUF4435) [Candidatus Kentron sp. LFY]
MNMQGHIGWVDIVDAIRLELKNKHSTDKVWIIVEGETDRRLFSKLIDGDDVEIEISHGGLNALLTIVSELSRETERILGIRDADFLHLEGEAKTPENIFLTDHHDAEMMIVSCDEVYRNLAIEHLPKTKPDDSAVSKGGIPPHEALSSRQVILRSIAFIAGLKWINHTRDLGLDFGNLGLGRFYDWHPDRRALVLDEDNYLDVIMERSGNKKGKVSREAIHLEIKDISDLLDLCNGHDFMRAFAIFSDCHRSPENKKAKKKTSHEDIGKAFRAAYRFMDFQKTRLYKRLQQWSNRQSVSLFKETENFQAQNIQ